MVLILFVVYLLLAAAVLWLVIFSDGRAALRRWIANAVRSGWRNGRERTRRVKRGMHASARATGGGAGRAWRWTGHQRWLLLALFLLLTFPPLLVLQLQGVLDLGRFVPGHKAPNPVVARLLKGEHLVPPQPLPPQVFTTREVETVRPDLRHANRKWDRLKPGFRQRLLAVYKIMQQKYGYHMVLIEGYRSPARQRRLASNGSNVTHASAFQSYHQFGLAADSAFLRHGKLVIARNDAWTRRGYKLYGRVAKRYGLTWGGNWSFHDYGHVELRGSKYDDPTTHHIHRAAENE